MLRNSSLLIIRECKHLLSPKCSRKLAKLETHMYSYVNNSAFPQHSEYGIQDNLLENFTLLSRSTHSSVLSKKELNINQNSIKESDKKTLNGPDVMQTTDKDIEPVIKVVSNDSSKSSLSSDIIPGKGPPPEPPIDCCMTGCVNCVWIKYAEELRDYYAADGLERAKVEIEKIENPSLKAFIKFEIGLL